VGYVVSRPLTILVDVVAWAVFHAGTGYLVHRMRSSRFEHDWRIHRPRGAERGGRLYVEILRIRRWKGWLPEAGDLFAGGFNKKRLVSKDRTYLSTYVRETRRAELGHWLCVACAPLFFLWNPWPIGVVMIVYAIAANGPCIASLRYNRLRLQRILSKG
jgi:glycosyl-4,4'-diaponeurosporenoate acyltransferase